MYLNNEIDYNIIDYLISLNDYFLTYQKGLQLVNKKSYSTKLLKDKLDYLKLTHVTEVINELVVLKILDDELFYEDYSFYLKQKGYGPVYINDKLYKAGINNKVIYTDDEQLFRLNNFLQNYLKLNYPINQILKKFINKMLYKGYHLGLIKTVIEEVDIVLYFDMMKLKNDYDFYLTKFKFKYTGKKLSDIIIKVLLKKGYSRNEINQLNEMGDDYY